jgi:hypothetical protein
MAKPANKKVFTIKDSKGKEVKLAVRKPKQEESKELQVAYNIALREAIDSKAILQQKVEQVLREQGVWDDAKEKEIKEVERKIIDGEKKLAMGGIKKSEAKALALEMRRLRRKRQELLSVRVSMDANTAQAQAENARFNNYVSKCTVYNETDERLFKSHDDYLAWLEDKDQAPTMGTILTNAMQFFYDMDPEADKKLPENKFLIQHGFMNDKLQLIRPDKKLVDDEGRLVDDEGRFINEAGEYVDAEGNRVDKDGNFVFKDAAPFIDG